MRHPPRLRRPRLPLLRRLAQKTGLQLVARRYALGAAAAPFSPRDVAGLAPVVRSCAPAETLPEMGELLRRATAGGLSSEASLALVQEAMALAYTVAK